MYNAKQRASYFMAHASTIMMWQVALVSFFHLFIYPDVQNATDFVKFKIGQPEFLAQSPTTSYSFGDWLFKPSHYGSFPIKLKVHSDWIRDHTLAWNRHVLYFHLGCLYGCCLSMGRAYGYTRWYTLG